MSDWLFAAAGIVYLILRTIQQVKKGLSWLEPACDAAAVILLALGAFDRWHEGKHLRSTLLAALAVGYLALAVADGRRLLRARREKKQ